MRSWRFTWRGVCRGRAMQLEGMALNFEPKDIPAGTARPAVEKIIAEEELAEQVDREAAALADECGEVGPWRDGDRFLLSRLDRNAPLR